MTVEAALILPIFILFFSSLMGLTNLIRTFVVINGATQAAAREMAVYAYPVDRISDFGGGILEDSNRIVPESVRIGLANHALKSQFDDDSILLECITIIAAEFPQGEDKFRIRKAAGAFESYSENFSADDVFIAILYQPAWINWIPGADNGIVFKAVRRGWSEGRGAFYSLEKHERSIFKEEIETVYVYITRTGIRYHREDCRYLAKSKYQMSLTEASEKYTPCKVCVPPPPPG